MMLLKNLTKVYISSAEETKNHGEPIKTWRFVSTAFLNLQQDVNELDRNSEGEVNYDIYKARTDKNYNIENGYGISLIDISENEDFIPEYRVLDQSKIGDSITYRLERYHGN